MFPQNDILDQIRRRRALEPPFATPPIALQQEAEQSKSDPWSERLPDGRTVNEAIMGTLRNSNDGAPRPGPTLSKEVDSIRSGNATFERDAIGRGLPSFDEARQEQDANAAAGRPVWTTHAGGYGTAPGWQRLPVLRDQQTQRNTASFDPNTPPPSGNENRPWKVGGSLEKDPLKREAARIRAMIENPASQVSASGTVDVPKPMGRLKASLLGALFGLAQGDRNTSLAERLAAGGAGAAVGGFKPRAVQDWRRRMEVEDAQGQLAQQTKLSAGQAQLENLRAETQSRMADLMMDPETGQLVKRPPRRAPQYVERADGVYEISEAHPNGRRIGNIPAEAKTGRRGAVHYENREDGVYAIYEGEDGQIKSQRVEGVPGKPSEREDKSEEFRFKREAKLAESERFYDKARNLDEQAKALDEHIKKLETGMATIPEFATSTTAVDPEGNPIQVPNPGREGHQKQINDLRKQQKDLRDEANKLRIDADKVWAEGQAVPIREPKQSGRRWSVSKWAAANPGADVEAAKKAAKAAGYTVIE